MVRSFRGETMITYSNTIMGGEMNGKSRRGRSKLKWKDFSPRKKTTKRTDK